MPLSLFGGAERDRTDDLLLAKQALSQLSYGTMSFAGVYLLSDGGTTLKLVLG